MNQVVPPYWEIVEKPIMDDSTAKCEYIEIREKNVNVFLNFKRCGISDSSKR